MRITSATAFAALFLVAAAAPADLPTHKSAKGSVVHLSGSRVSERSPFDWGDVAKPFEKVGNFITGQSGKEEQVEDDSDSDSDSDDEESDNESDNEKRAPAEKRSPLTWDEFKAPFIKMGDAVTGNDKNKE